MLLENFGNSMTPLEKIAAQILAKNPFEFARWCKTTCAVARRWGRSAPLIRMTPKFAPLQLRSPS